MPGRGALLLHCLLLCGSLSLSQLPLRLPAFVLWMNEASSAVRRTPQTFSASFTTSFPPPSCLSRWLFLLNPVCFHSASGSPFPLSPCNTPPFFPLPPAPFLSAFLLWVAFFCFQGSQAFPDGTQTSACQIRLLCQAQTLRLLHLKSCLHFKHRKQNNTGRRVPVLLVIWLETDSPTEIMATYLICRSRSRAEPAVLPVTAAVGNLSGRFLLRLWESAGAAAGEQNP